MASARSGRPASSSYSARCHQLWTVNRLPASQPRAVGAQEADALVDAALHLVRVHDGVDGPHVVGVGLDGGEPGVERLAVVARLLQPERGHARARTAHAGGRGRARAGSGSAGRAGSGRRRRRSRAGGRTSAPAGRSASARAGRRAARRRRPSRPAIQAPMASAWACSRSLPPAPTRARWASRGRGQIGGVGAHQVQVGEQRVRHRDRRRRRRPARWRGRRPRGGTARGGRSPGRSGRSCRRRPTSGCRGRQCGRLIVMGRSSPGLRA